MIAPKKRRTTRLCRPSATLSILLAGLCASPVAAESQQELLLFPSLDTYNTFKEERPEIEDSFVRGTLNVLYSYSGERFRFLGEYLWSSHESELERFKGGWQWQDDTMLWLGRFHSTARYWTSEYHHGQFLQTPITRPSLEEWEDESGPIPSHITGLSLEVDRQRGDDSAFGYAISAGLAPKFAEHELVPYDVLDPGSDHGLAVNFRLVYRPEFLSPMQVGFISGWNEINVVSESSPDLTDLDRIDQLTVGGFADWRWSDFRLIASLVYLNNEMKYVDANVNDDFLLSYVQFEYAINEDFTFFGRTDNGFSEDQSAYLRLLPGFIAHRHMLGLRWDVASFHSLTVEIADTSRQGDGLTHDHFKEIRFQWSAVYP